MFTFARLRCICVIWASLSCIFAEFVYLVGYCRLCVRTGHLLDEGKGEGIISIRITIRGVTAIPEWICLQIWHCRRNGGKAIHCRFIFLVQMIMESPPRWICHYHLHPPGLQGIILVAMVLFTHKTIHLNSGLWGHCLWKLRVLPKTKPSDQILLPTVNLLYL